MRTVIFGSLMLVAACTGSDAPPTDTTTSPTSGDSGDTGSQDTGVTDTGSTMPTGDTGDTGPRTCEDIEADFWAEAEAIQTCDDASECGQVLTGTSCGCTRDWVARLDADTSDFYALIDEGQAEECELLLSSVCDCPPAKGFDCIEGTCTWNYVDSTPYLPVCFEADGDAYSIDGVALDGAELVVSVGYSGGCEDHDFVLCWPDQAFMESYPVQVALEVSHDAHGDACEAWIREELRFDLSPMSQAYFDSYGSKTGTMSVNVGDVRIDWTF